MSQGNTAQLTAPQFDGDTVAMLTDNRFPYLYSRGREVDELILQEVFVNLRTGGSELQAASLPEDWCGMLAEPWIFSISQQPLQLVAGMMYWDRNFLFDSLPFICSRTKDVKCRLENSDGGRDDLSNSMKLLQMSFCQRYISAMNLTGKAAFRLVEYECCSMYFIVQSYQLITDGNPLGKYFFRAFYPFRQPQPQRALPGANAANSSEAAQEDSFQLTASSSAGRELSNTWGARSMRRTADKARRRAVPGEERLRLLRPWFYEWCLERDPGDMGAAIAQIKTLFLYYRHNFRMIRVVRLVMRSVKVLQRFIRRKLAAKKRTVLLMVATWELMEREVEEKLRHYVPIPNDSVDAAVNAALRSSITTTKEHKFRVIETLQMQRKQAYLAASQEQRTRDENLFRWMINPNLLFQDSQKRTLDRLITVGPDSLFNNPAVQAELIRLQKEVFTQRKTQSTRRKKGTIWRN
jgi:hypothetical protein